MAGSDRRRTGVLGRWRDKRDKRRQRSAEKARVEGEARRELERAGKSDLRSGNTGGQGPAAGGF